MVFARSLAALAWLLCAALGAAAPQLLLSKPLPSPDSKLAANVEWDSAGFIGRIRMMAYTNGDTPSVVAELPQIKPAPANLTWITDTWFACESFVAEDGAAFCYMNVPEKRVYMIEIFAPDGKPDWLISYTTNDPRSSSTIQTVSAEHSSLFPILLRDLPRSGMAYLSPDFAYLLSDAVDSFVQWRTKQDFREIKMVSKMAEDPDLGRLLIAEVDTRAELLYFPAGTTSTREMLALTQRKPLPENVQDLMQGIDPPVVSPEWTNKEGAFRLVAHWNDHPTSKTELAVGRFEGVKDAPYQGPGVAQLVSASPEAPADEAKSGESAASKTNSKKSVVVEPAKKASPAKPPPKKSAPAKKPAPAKKSTPAKKGAKKPSRSS